MTMTHARLTQIRDIILRSIAEHPHGNHNPTHTASREEVLELVEFMQAREGARYCPKLKFGGVLI